MGAWPEDLRRMETVLAAREMDSATFFGRHAAEWGALRRELFGDAFLLPTLLALLPAGLTVANLDDAGPGGVDAPDGGSGLSRYVRDLLDPSLSWKDLDWLAGLTKLPVVVKGLVRPDDARRAVAHGARAVVVSNHGGRQLDTAPATAEVLGPVVDAVDGAAEVLVDGGIRRGTDVIKALALGARAVLVGRPALWGLAVGGQAGVEAALGMLRAELLEGMALCGTPDVVAMTRDLVEGVRS